MNEENDKSKSYSGKDDDGESSRVAARRTQREARRSSGRSASLKRKATEPKPTTPVSSGVEKEQSSSPAKDRARAKPRSRRPTAKKQEKTTRTAKETTFSSSAAKKKRAKPAKTTRYQTGKNRASAKEEEGEFEIRSQPDGTSRRVKITKSTKKRVVKKSIQKFVGQSGPGPAIVDLATVSPGIWTRKRDIDLAYAATETQESLNYLKRYISVSPKVVVVLGSGLSEVAQLVDGEAIPFSNIPGFNSTQVPGHTGQIRTGMLKDTPVMFLEGRGHFYETGSMKATVHPVLTALAMGARHVILTTAAGAINTSYKPGEIMIVKDHINMMGDNPLFGKSPSAKPSVFVDCSEIYDQSIVGNAGKLCRAAGVKKRIGILAGVRGPVYETPTEKAWLKYMGIDAVCMSVIPEALAAAYLGIKVTGLALITNQASPRKKEPIRHEDVVSSARQHTETLKKMISVIIESQL